MERFSTLFPHVTDLSLGIICCVSSAILKEHLYDTERHFFLLSLQDILPTGIMEEINELFVDENKLNAAVAEANTLPTISITKVTDTINIHP